MAEFDATLLRSFVATVETGSITRAAVMLGRTQPAVSQQLRRLEDLVGQPLVRRSAQGIELTEAGEALLPYAERILALGAEARETLQSSPRSLRGKCGIGVIEDLTGTTLPDALTEVARAYPDIQLDVFVASSTAMRDAFESNRIQLLLGDPAYMSPLRPDCRVGRRLCWVAAPGFDLRLDPLPLALFSQPCRWREPLLDALNAKGIRWRVAFESTSLGAVQAAVRSGFGISALLPENVQAGMVALEDATIAPAPAIELALFRRMDTRHSAVVGALAGILERTMKRHQYSGASPATDMASQPLPEVSRSVP